jgi:hypothetical protein
MFKSPVRRLAQQLQFASQLFQQAAPQQASRAMVAVQQDAIALLSNPRDIDQVQHQAEVLGHYILAGHDLSNLLVRHPFELAAAVSLGHGTTLGSANNAPVGPEQFQAIVLGRVVAGRNLDATHRLMRPHQYTGGRCCRHIGIDHGPPHRSPSGADRVGQHPARGAPISSQYQWPRRQTTGHGAAEPHRQLGRKALSDDAS